MSIEATLNPGERQEMRNHVLRSRGVVRPRRWFCDEIVQIGHFCFGCQEFVCNCCDNGEPGGDHKVEEHCVSDIP